MGDIEGAHGRNTFVKRLVNAMAGSMDNGGRSAKRQNRMKEIGNLSDDKDGFPKKVANARFLLGADDGAYLRTNVMPLQTSENECDDALGLSWSLTPQLENAGRLGMLLAMEQAIKQKSTEKIEQLKQTFEVAGWLLSIHEVCDFVSSYLTRLGDGGMDASLKTTTQLVNNFNVGGVSLRIATNSLLEEKNREYSCRILSILLLLFDLPRDTVELQIKKTYGEEGTGTGALEDAITCLSLAPRFVKSVWDTNSFTYKAVNIEGAAAAIAANVLANRTIDYTVTEFPPGWEQGHDKAGNGSFTSGVEHSQRIFANRMEIAARVPTLVQAEDTNLQHMDEKINESKANLQDVAKKIEAMENKQGVSRGDQSALAAVQLDELKLEQKVWEQILKTWQAERDSKVAETEYNRYMRNFERSDENQKQLNARDLERQNALADLEEAQRNLVRVADEQEKALVAFALIKDKQQASKLEDALEVERDAFTKFNNWVMDYNKRMAEIREEQNESDKRIKAFEAGMPILNEGAVNVRLQQSKQLRAEEKAEDDKRKEEILELKTQLRSNVNQFLQAGRQRTQQPPAFCMTEQVDEIKSVHALCAGVSQMREDGGGVISENAEFLRGTGVSPFFIQPHRRHVERKPQRDGYGPDWWSTKLFPQAQPAQEFNMDQFRQNVQNARTYDEIPTKPRMLADIADIDNRPLVYAVARGLCGKRAPHHAVTDNTDRLSTGTLRYNVPQIMFPSNALPVGSDFNETAFNNTEKIRSRSILGSVGIPARKDFVQRPFRGRAPSTEPQTIAKWAPVKKATVGRGLNETVYTVLADADTRAVAESCVLEHLVDDYAAIARESSDNPTYQTYSMACAAYAKIKQLRAMATVFRSKTDLSALVSADPGADEKNVFVTRPVLRCPGPESEVLYPCDAGLAHFRKLDEKEKKKFGGKRINKLGPEMAWGACVTPAPPAAAAAPPAPPAPPAPTGAPAAAAAAEGPQPQCTEREKGLRSEWTPHLRNALTSEDASPEDVPLYLAAAPGVGTDTPSMKDGVKPPETRSVSSLVYPSEDEDAFVAPDHLAKVLRYGIHICGVLEQYQHETKAVDELKKADPNSSSSDKFARERREAVWTDALREACISGDRLYAFIRQLSGTISENVDTVCQIDEGMLVRQQQQRREQSMRLADRAAQEHMQLVRGVFSTVLKESGLTLAIESNGKISELKVASNTLRKQVSELANGSSSSDGFFSNSVKLENLLAQGTGDMTLSQLFEKIQEAGVALQHAAFSTQPTDGLPGSNASLDFLSAPRNSLMLRYKPEALAAIRSAFDIFQRELRNQCGRMHRAISAFELIEGKNETLCAAFATFAAHMLVNSRMYSSATAMYVAAWPAAANAQQLKISLQRLVSIAMEYLAFEDAPDFMASDGRARYFGGGSGPPRFLVPVPRALQLNPPKGGFEKVNFFGNS